MKILAHLEIGKNVKPCNRMEVVKKIELGKQVIFIYNHDYKSICKFTNINNEANCLIQM